MELAAMGHTAGTGMMRGSVHPAVSVMRGEPGLKLTTAGCSEI